MSWRVLQLDVPSVSKILVKSTLHDSGYRVELTDLSRIWSESVTKEEIIHRAVDAGSSIDPSEDDEQFGIFLSKIEGALNGDDGTTLSVSNAGDADSLDLRLDLTAPLPHPLPPFKWTLQLQRQPEDHIERELVTPLIFQANRLSHQIQQLVDELHNKDRVISKICDRLETSGNDLTTVFPGVSNIKTSRKKGQREQLAKHVKGLEDFNESEWRKRSKVSSGDELDAGMVDDVFRDLPTTGSNANATDGVHWWEHLGRGSQALLKPEVAQPSFASSKANARQNSEHKISLVEEDNLRDDEFQRQGTPPLLKPNHGKANQAEIEKQHGMRENADANTIGGKVTVVEQIDDESTTDDDDDLDLDLDNTARARASSKKASAIIAEEKTSHSPKKIGSIGGRSSDQAATRSPKQTEVEELESSKPRSKLGAIGGKPKSPSPASVSAREAEPGNRSPTAKASKLGTIGGKKASASASPPPTAANNKLSEAAQEPSPRQSRTPVRQKTPPPRETSQERADKKRDQLKRELEEKAKAPVKKKRKF